MVIARWIPALLLVLSSQGVGGAGLPSNPAPLPSHPETVRLPDPPLLTTFDADRLGVPARRLELETSPLPEREVARTRRVIEKAMARYPSGFLRRHVRAVVVVGRLAFRGTEVGGTYHRNVVFVANYGRAQGSTDAWLKECLHHEVSSVLYHAHARSFPHERWRAVLPEGFRYGRGGFAAVREGRACEAEHARELRDGFACEYGRAAFEEDLNTIAERMMSRPRAFDRLCARHPRLAIKRDLVQRFYLRMDPRFRFEREPVTARTKEPVRPAIVQR